MSGLFGSMNIALRALLAQQGAISTASNNIANVNTPGYSRQRAVMTAAPPVNVGNFLIGNGVELVKVENIRDRILELRMHQETQQQSELDAFLGPMKQIEALFNDAQGGGLGGVINNFFNSLSQLSTNPSSLPLRQGVLTAGQNMATAFRSVAGNLVTQQRSLDQTIQQSVDDINRYTTQVAALNKQITAQVGVGKQPNELLDQREVLIRKISELVDVAIIDSQDGSITLTTSGGTALAVGDQSVALQTQPGVPTGLLQIFSQGSNITGQIKSGRLGGTLTVRDTVIPSILADVDTLAAGIASSVNTAHQAGFDLNGAAGGNFFVPPPATGAAAGMNLAFSNPALVAASSDGTPGSNGNAVALSGLRDQAVVASQKPSDFYSTVVFRIGNDVSSSTAEYDAENLVLRQLENQRAAISGVSLDEEAANLIRFQRAFEAQARVIAAVDELTRIAINLGRG
ncbi:MAG: flagellar hook-associated protein FlgK [Acidobacteria bacterium]|nr:flagellar hook-associated protein FlgK [Acidobacteriota bacterium]MBI3662981.1 flagellar hook-associated protein FlgK [Acidobacteriota bacterium]